MSIDYIAGFFDGEGTFGVYGSNQKPNISVTQTEVEILREMRDFVGLGNIYKEKIRNKNWSQSYKWSITGRENCLTFISLIKPHLRLKRKIDKANEIEEVLTIQIKAQKEQLEERKHVEDSIIQLSKSGLSCRKIAERVGLSRSTVNRIIKNKFAQ